MVIQIKPTKICNPNTFAQIKTRHFDSSVCYNIRDLVKFLDNLKIHDTILIKCTKNEQISYKCYV